MARDPSKRCEVVADEMRQVIGALTRRLRAESGANELSSTGHAAMRRLMEEGPSTTAALARAESVKPQSMGVTLAALEEECLVVRTVDAIDGRCRNVSITEKGKRVLIEGRAVRQNWLARTIDQELDGEEQRALLAALALIRRVVAS